MAERLEPNEEGHSEERADQPVSMIQPVVPALWLTLGPWLLLVCVAALAVTLWIRGDWPFIHDEQDQAQMPSAETTGTVGRDTDTPGGFNPDKTPGSTRDELEQRGVGSPFQGTIPGLVEGRQIEARNAQVLDAGDGKTIWIQHDGNKTAVLAPDGAPSLRTGMRVDVRGVTEPDGRGGLRIRATRIDVRD